MSAKPHHMVDHEVVVVGASTAGLVAARDLARAGMRTLVVDSRPSFDEPERTWIVTQRMGELLDLDLTPCLVHETGVMELIANGRSRSVRLEDPDWIVERAALRRLLAEAATEAGAKIELGRRVKDVTVGSSVFTASL
ncbi:MAG: FAD-dependent monooxygenase, partial [Gemmatimonadota bacterium]|nr:FAD-dependent monooxygenase [Gemmatimonadota bacterium]